MGRTRGKGKKQNVTSSQEDLGSGKEEKIPANRRRGRPMKDNHEEEEELKEGDRDDKDLICNNDWKSQATTENGRKRKRAGYMKGNKEPVKEENGDVGKLSTDNSTVSIGFRQNGSRRKNKPRRAAEAMVECN